MANSIEVLGLQLLVIDGKVAPPSSPFLEIQRWEAALSEQRLHLEADWVLHGLWAVSLDLDIRLVVDGSILRAADGPQPQSAAAHFQLFPVGSVAQRGALEIEASLLTVKETAFDSDRVEGLEGDLWFRVPTASAFADSRLPIKVAGTSRSMLGPRFGDSSAILLREGFFRGTTSVIVELGTFIGSLNSRLFQLEHLSRAMAIPLAERDELLRLGFDPVDPERCLVLHGESTGNPSSPRARAGLGIRDHCLVLEVAPNAVSAQRHRIERICVEPQGEAGFCVEAYDWAHQGNDVARFRSEPLGKTPPLDLHLRPREGSERAGSLLVAPVHRRGVDQEQLFLKPEGLAAGTTIHGPLKHGRFHLGEHGCLVCEEQRTLESNAPTSIADSLLSEATMPWLFFPQASEKGLDHAKAGEAHVEKGLQGEVEDGALPKIDAVRVRHFQFGGGSQALPILDDSQLRPGDELIQEAVWRELNNVWRGQSSSIPETEHETGYRERDPQGQGVRPAQVFGLLDDDGGATTLLRLSRHEVERSIGPFQIRLVVPDSLESPDYVVLRRNDGHVFGGQTPWNLQPDPSIESLKLGGEPGGEIVGVLKLSQRYSLQDIFEREEDLRDLPTGDDPKMKVLDVLDPMVRQRGWIGLLLFDLPLDFGDFPVLSKLVSPDALHLVYLAVTPSSRSQVPSERDFSVQGKVRWTNPTSGIDPNSLQEDSETTVRTNLVEIAWHDNRLTHFLCDVDVTISGLFGLKHEEGPPPRVKILGSYDEEKRTFRFLGQLGSRLPVLPRAGGSGPFKQVFLKSAEVRAVEDRVSILLDGEFELQAFGYLDDESLFGCEDGCRVRFQSLDIPLAVPENDFARWLSYQYLSVRFDLGGPHHNLGYLELKTHSVGVDFQQEPIDWSHLVHIQWPDLEGPIFYFTLRLQLMRLPELKGIQADRLNFELVLGFGVTENGGWDASKVRVGIRAFSLSGLRVPLLRFVELTTEKIELRRREVDEEQIPWILFSNVDVNLLGVSIIDDLSVSVFSRKLGRQYGLVGYLPNPVSLGFLKIFWVFVGQNVELSSDLAQKLISVGIPWDHRESDFGEDLTKAIENLQFLPRESGSPHGEWIVAAGFDFLNGFVLGKLLFQDRRYYGLALGGGLLKDWFGYDLGISVLYIKGETERQDAFFLALRVPSVNLTGFRFQGGVIEILVGVDGSFKVDIGFPWLDPRGGRQWHRCFGAIFSIYQGSAGAYIAKRQLTMPGENYLQVAGGYACQAGFGASFGGRLFKVWVTIGFYVVFDGEMFLQDSNLRGMRLTGAVGVLFRGAGELDWWIISVRVEIMLSLEARATLLWGTIPQGNLLPADTSAESQGALVVLTFEAAARVSARACIGSGWFKICKRVRVSTVLRLSTTLKL